MQIMVLLGLKGGPAVGKMTERVVDWQLAHPGGSTEECKEWLQQQWHKQQEAEASQKAAAETAQQAEQAEGKDGAR
jgi:hypothetical protein